MRIIKINIYIFIVIIYQIAFTSSMLGQTKLAQTGFQFLSVNPDARSASLGGAMTTLENYSSALFSNPAVLAEITNTADVMIGQNIWIADIKHNAFCAAYKPWDGLYGTFGVSALFIDYGEVEGTIVAKNEQGFLETGTIKPTAYAIGFGYSRALSEKFSVGGQVKHVYQYLGPTISDFSVDLYNSKINSNELSVLAFDFGTIYKTGFKSLIFGMSVQNFAEEIKYARENFQLPLTFNIGVSMNLANLFPEEFQTQQLMLTADAVHPRSHPEQVKFGIEYKYFEILALRIGYTSDLDERSFSYGIGLKQFGFVLDYAYTPFGVFDNVQRFSLRFSM